MFRTLLNEDGSMSMILVLTDQLGAVVTSVQGTATIQQINQLGTLVCDIQAQLHNYYRATGLCPYPLRIFVSLANSLAQLSAHHYDRYHVASSFSRLPMLWPQEQYHWGSKATFHLQAAVECDNLASRAQTCLAFARDHGVGEVWRHIDGAT